MINNTSNTRSVLLFHGVNSPSRVLEDGEAIFWLTRKTFCEILDSACELGAAAPEITFDDGNLSDIEIALPELQARGMRARSFC